MFDFFGALFFFALVVVAPIAIVLTVVGLRSRVTALEKSVAGLQDELATLRRRPAAEPPRQPAAAEPVVPEPATPPAFAPEPVVPEPVAPPAFAPEPVAPPAFVPPPFARLVPEADVEPARLAARGPGLEQRLVTKLPVWIGSLALFLAGAYLVKFTFDRGLLGPTARVVLGILFGVALLAGGEFLRSRSRQVAQGLSAAGIADLYASLLAAITLYQLIPRPIGFGLLALVTATAVALSLRHGPLIAVLGLVGGFVTPALIGSNEHNAPALFTYLFLLEVGLLAAARPRRWWPIGALLLAGGALWSGLWMLLFFRPGDALPIGLFLLASVAAFALLGRARQPESWGGATIGRALHLASPAAGIAMLALLVNSGSYGTLEWCFLGLLSAGVIVLARLEPDYEPLAWVASAAGVLLLCSWTARHLPESALPISHVALGMGALVTAGAYAASFGAARPSRWTALAAASALLYFFPAWAARQHEPPPFGWGAWALLLAMAFVAASWPLVRRRAAFPGAESDQALAALAVAATAFIAAAVPLELERYMWSVAWALEVAALAFIESRLRVAVLRRLALALGAGVIVRLVLNPAAFEYAPGSTLIVNWILFGYGVPVAAFALAGFFYRRMDEPRAGEAAEGGAIVLALALLALEVRHYFVAGTGADLDVAGALMRGRVQVAELGAIVIAWLLLARGLFALDARTPRRSLSTGGSILAGVTFAGGLGLLAAPMNPLFSGLPVGATPLANAVLFTYGVPAVLALLFSGVFEKRGEPQGARACGVAALLFALLCVTLEIRQLWHGTVLSGPAPRGAELYAYSAAYVVCATALLLAAIVRRGVVLRWASLAVMLLAVGKVFLWDLAQLTDLYRVFSLLGLGASLMLIAFLYSRFVFTESR